MTTLSIFFLLFLTVVFAISKKTKITWILGAVTLLLFASIGCGIMPSLLFKSLEIPPVDQTTQPVWKKSNAFAVLGYGMVLNPITKTLKPTDVAYPRIYEATRLYRACIVSGNECRIVVSGGDPAGVGESEAAVYQREFTTLGVPEADIFLESQSDNTYENAKFTSYILQTRFIEQTFLVTSSVHMKRSLLYFANFKVKAIPAVAGYLKPKLTALPLGYNFAVCDFIIHEYIGILRYRLYHWK